MAVLGKPDGPQESVAAVGIDETGKQTCNANDGRPSRRLAVEE